MTNTLTISRDLAERLDSPHSSVRNAALESLRRIIAAPVVERQEPVGAIENGRIFKDRVEQLYLFKDEYGHPLLNCSDWQEFVKCFEYLAEHTSPPAPVAVVPDGWKLVPIEPTMGMLEALMEWREVGNVNAYNSILESAPACLDKVKEMNK